MNKQTKIVVVQQIIHSHGFCGFFHLFRHFVRSICSTIFHLFKRIQFESIYSSKIKCSFGNPIKKIWNIEVCEASFPSFYFLKFMLNLQVNLPFSTIQNSTTLPSTTLLYNNLLQLMSQELNNYPYANCAVDQLCLQKTIRLKNICDFFIFLNF